MQISFGMFVDRDLHQKKTILEEIIQVIDFGKMDQILQGMYTNEGRPPIPPIILFKTLLLEAWYRLSDVQLVEEIHNRRSFERFPYTLSSPIDGRANSNFGLNAILCSGHESFSLCIPIRDE